MNTNATHSIENEGDGDYLVVTIQLAAKATNDQAWDAIYAYIDRVNKGRPAWDELRTKGGILTPKGNGLFRAVVTLK